MKRGRELAKKRQEKEDEEREKKEQRELAKQRRDVMGLIEAGQLGRAMGRTTSHGLGDISDPDIRQHLTDKFPPRSQPLPPSALKTKPIDSFKNLRHSGSWSGSRVWGF